MKISEYFKKIRTEKGLRIVDFCEQLDISHTHLTKIENGYMDNPTPTMAARICRMLDIEPSELKQFDFNPDQEFINNVTKRLEEKDPVDVSFAISSFERELLPKLFESEENKGNPFKYTDININIDKFEEKSITSTNSIYSTKYDASCTNTTKKRTVEIFYIPTRKLRRFSYKFDSLCKNVPDFVSSLISSLAYPYHEFNKEIYFLTTSNLIYNEIKDCFSHPIETADVIMLLCYIDPKNAEKHEYIFLAKPNINIAE